MRLDYVAVVGSRVCGFFKLDIQTYALAKHFISSRKYRMFSMYRRA